MLYTEVTIQSPEESSPKVSPKASTRRDAVTLGRICQKVKTTIFPEVTLIDGLYGYEPEFRAWLKRRPANRMTLVVKGTEKRARPFVRSLRRVAVKVDHVPEHYDQLSRAARRAKLLSIRSQYGHMELVTEGKTIPVVLRRGNLPTATTASSVAVRQR